MKSVTLTDVTEVLADLGQSPSGDKVELLHLIHDELRKLAHAKMRGERADHTLEPTALAHEAFLQLIGGGDARWENRAHFFGAAAEAMRRILVDYARSRQAQKRGGGRCRVPLDEILDDSEDHALDVIAIDEALSRLSDLDPQKARVVELRFFGGLNVEETAAALAVSPRTVKREWSFAKAWLFREIGVSGER